MSETQPNQSHDASRPQARGHRPDAWSVLVASSTPGVRSLVESVADEMNCAVRFAQTRDEALDLVSSCAFDAAIVSASLVDGSGLDVLDALRASPINPGVIVASEDDSAEAAISYVRRGACDVLRAPYDGHALSERLDAALQKIESERRRDRKVERLRTICRRLNKARREVSEQVDELCTDLVHAYQELADQVTHSTLASEFGAQVRQELDIESLLRTVLEAMLSRTGPTNAAVFLPTGHCDFNLGAYVNQSMHGETVDVLLDHLADVIPGEFEAERDVLRVDDRAEQWEWVRDEAEWLNGSTALVFSCIAEEECLAVVMLFRPEGMPFSDELISELGVMRDIFAEQLDRIVRVHHRTMPDLEAKGFDIGFDDEDDDSDDYGDSSGDWSGGMAA